MLKNSIAWGICAVLIFAALTAYGFIYTNKTKEYRTLEENLVAAAKKYGEIKFAYTDTKEGTNVSFEDLKKENLIEDLKVGDEECAGYANIKNNNLVYEYKGFIKCKKYKTKGYQE